MFSKRESARQRDYEEELARDYKNKDEELEDFLQENSLEDRYVIRVFRKFYDTGGRKKHAFLKTFRDQIPDYELIGTLFGPGDYQLNVAYTDNEEKRRHTSRLITIDGTFQPDRDAQRHAAAYITDRPGMGQSTGNNNMQPQADTIELFKEFLRLYTGLISSAMQNNKSGNGLEMLESIQMQMSDMMVRNFEQQQKLVNRITAKSLEIPDEDEDEEAPNPIYQILKMIWDKYGEQILNAPAFIQKRTAREFQKLDAFQAITENPDQFSDAYQTLVERDGVDKSKIDRLLKLAGIEVQEGQERQTVEPTQQQEKQG